jgi:hypothetical protein
MDVLIKQAFAGEGPLSKYVDEGEYDLVNEHGDTILPTLWESTVQPGWTITMHMWQTRQSEIYSSFVSGVGAPISFTNIGADTKDSGPSSQEYTSLASPKYETTSPASSVRLDWVKGQSAVPQLKKGEHEERFDAMGNKITVSRLETPRSHANTLSEIC